MGYTSALLEAKGFPGAYSDGNVLEHGIANGQTVANIMEGHMFSIGPKIIKINTSMVILHNTSSESPTQAEVNEIGETLWGAATQVREHYHNEIDVSVRINPVELGPFGNNKLHFYRETIDDGQVKRSNESE